MKTYIGADPGKNGGIASLRGSVANVWKMPETERDLLNLLVSIKNASMECFALVEIVHSSPQQGVKSAFTFGQGYGALRMALTASGIPFEGVRPQVWQKELGCLTGGDKNVSKTRAQSLFPALKLTHATADSLLIAEYGKRKGI
jgi:hypothetical protein